MDDSECDFEPQGYELEGEGALNQPEENETTLLFAKLGDELQMLVQRYNVPPTDLEELFQVSSPPPLSLSLPPSFFCPSLSLPLSLLPSISPPSFPLSHIPPPPKLDCRPLTSDPAMLISDPHTLAGGAADV